MENENQYLNFIKQLVEENKFISLYDELKKITDETIAQITTDEFLKMKELPNRDNFKNLLENYENHMSLLIKVLSSICRFRNGLLYERIDEVVEKFIHIRKNDMDEYGYMWRNACNYPLLLIVYCLGISFLKSKSFEDLFSLLGKKVVHEYDLGKKSKVAIFEEINCYHVFNSVGNTSASLIQFFPQTEQGNIQTDAKEVLIANKRIYQYLFERMGYYFRDQVEFSDYFDLYEFFIGLVYIDKSIADGYGTWSPFGKNYFKYSGKGRTHITFKESLVYNYLNDNGENILGAGFFDKKQEKFQKIFTEYQSFLYSISGY